MARIRIITLLLLCGLLVACGSTPRSNYFMLSADATGLPDGSGPSLGVGPISIPDYLKAREMVLNRSDHALRMAEYDRWAEPLDSAVLRVLAVNLSSLMDSQNIQIYPWRRDSIPRYSVRVAVIQLATQDTKAHFVAEWSVHKTHNGGVLSQHISQLETASDSSDPETIAAAYSNLLLQLSEEIATAIKDYDLRQPDTDT